MIPVGRRMWTGEFNLSPEDSAHISSGATFFQRREGEGKEGLGWGGGKARRFPSLISEHYKQWSYSSIMDTKAASEKGIGEHFQQRTLVFREGKMKRRMRPRLI